MTYGIWLPKILGLVLQQFGMFKIELKLFKRFLVDEFTVGVAVGGEGSEANSTTKKKMKIIRTMFSFMGLLLSLLLMSIRR